LSSTSKEESGPARPNEIVVHSSNLFAQSLHPMFDGMPQGIDPAAVRSLLLGLPNVTQDLPWAVNARHFIFSTGTHSKWLYAFWLYAFSCGT